MTWTPEVEIRQCTIQRRHRAWGILMNTPRRVVIEDNVFRTAGAALLVEGDAQYWYESGAVTDSLIRRNTFGDCFSSRGWGEAPITITPSHKPQDKSAEPCHRNIRIEDNVFKVFDHSILYARSVRGLVFGGNRIERSRTHPPFSPAAAFILDGCREVQFKGNTLHGEVPDAYVKTLHITPPDLAVSPGQGIEPEQCHAAGAVAKTAMRGR